MSHAFYTLTRAGSPARLAAMRKTNPTDWRTARHWTLKTWESAFVIGTNYAFAADDLCVRDCRYAHDILPRLPRGWYTDDDADDTAIGIVCRLSHGRFVAGYHWTSNDEFSIDTDKVYTDEHDAARASDGQAESFAESARDNDARFRAMTDAEGLCESKERDLCDAWDECRATRAAYVADPMRHARADLKAREWVRELIVDLRAFRLELADATRAYERG